MNRSEIERADLLQFRQTGRSERQRLGLNYTLADVERPTAETVKRASARSRAKGHVAY